MDGQFNGDSTPNPSDYRGTGICEPLLLDPNRMNADLRLASRAVRERWRLSDPKCDMLVNRLFDVAEKKTVSVPTKFGVKECEGPADANAIAAASVIVRMMGQNQDDDHHEDDKDKPSGPTVNVNVVNQVQSAIAAEPEYLEWLRGQGLAESGNADAVGRNGFSAKILGASPHPST